MAATHVSAKHAQSGDTTAYCITSETKYVPATPVRSRFPIPYDALLAFPVPDADRAVNYFNAAVRCRLGVVDLNVPHDLVNKNPFNFKYEP